VVGWSKAPLERRTGAGESTFGLLLPLARGWAAGVSGGRGVTDIAGNSSGITKGWVLAMVGGLSGWTAATVGAGVVNDPSAALGVSVVAVCGSVSVVACITFDNWSAKPDATVGQFICAAPAGSTDCSDEATEGVGDAAAVDVGSGVMS
jgi:hypothetical protein